MDHDKNKPIDLKAFPGTVNGGRFVVVYGELDPADEAVFCLTPHVMQWAQHIYLLDLHSCINYWELQKQQLDISLLQLYERVLLSVFGDKAMAVVCAHPWQGLCFLYYLIDTEAPGVYALSSLFNKNTYKKLPWQYWFSALSVLGEHLEAIRARHFKASSFRAKTAQLQRFIRRLDLPGPYALQQADVAAIKRRYSGWTGEAWGWTFQPVIDNATADLCGFPWRPLISRKNILVERHLDYPVSQWDMVEPLLKQDFSKLCLQRGWSSQDKINSMHWRITLFNLEQVDVIIGFRHPYSLHKEKAEYRTALYQAYYAYVDMMQRITSRDSDLDLPEQMPFISWQLEITQHLHLPQIVLDMFESEKPGASYKRILDLQNCLPKALEHYVITPDFVPDQLFRKSAPGDRLDYGFSLKQWIDVDLPRPLFYYRQPVSLQTTSIQSRRFLERTAYNWWQSENSRDLVRDYFLLKNTQDQYIWVYRNSAGEWYQHGIYS